jgi:DNA-binding NtrC family response regulator
VGTNDPIDVDVRVICATNGDLNHLVKEGKFREDLLYRINTVELTMPTLRERLDDIPVLADHFLKIFCKKYQKQIGTIGEEALTKLKQNNWPGNIRELQHAMERAVIMNDSGSLAIADFHFLAAKTEADPFEDLNLEKVEAWAIRSAIKKHNGNVTHAARELGLSRGALYRRLDRYGI